TGPRLSGPVRLATIDTQGDAASLTVARVSWAVARGRVTGDVAPSVVRETAATPGKKPGPGQNDFGGRREVLDDWRREAALPLR
ncbi:MAG: hypothetical protein U0641_15965, partial [Anaerolineae bacterium]